MTQICEACERVPVDVIEPCDNADNPYKLCTQCHKRLNAYALRPVEWYNLAKRYGWWQACLHDDLYGEDGTAFQPQAEVESPESFPAPTLSDVSSDPEQLLNFTITRWGFDDDVANAWRAHPAAIVLDVVTRRFVHSMDVNLRSSVLEVISILGPYAADFVRNAWKDDVGLCHLYSLAGASASCLDPEEGHSRVADALSLREGADRVAVIHALFEFHSRRTLDWIEANICPPLTSSWGNLAAGSEFDWPRARKWIEQGRPLSLIAVDVLEAIIQPQTPALRSYAPRLFDPPDHTTLEAVLTSYLQRDSVPRVKKTTQFILANAAALIPM